MATTVRQTSWLAAVAGVWVLMGCTNPHVVVMPTDGVHVTGAINAVYPITKAGTCPLVDMGNGLELGISANPGPGQAYFGAEVGNFTGPRTYTDVQWPPNGHSSLYAAVDAQSWRAESGQISVTSFGNGKAFGTLSASHLREVGGSTTVDVAGSWACSVLLPQPVPMPVVVPSPSPSPSPVANPSPSPSPSPIGNASPSPSPVGVPVTRQILPPAKELPIGDLCSQPIQVFQDGNAGPLFCGSGALNVTAWRFFIQVSANVLALGHNATLGAVQTALCADITTFHATPVEETSAYQLAFIYNGWDFGTDPTQVMYNGGCP
jgi:hypothetical protein